MEMHCPICNASMSGATPPQGCFRCPMSTQDEIHPLTKRLDLALVAAAAPTWNTRAGESPLVAFRELLGSWQLAHSLGVGDQWEALVRAFSNKAESELGETLVQTPLVTADALAQDIGLPRGTLHVKNETVQLTGSHKSRHLASAVFYLEALRLVHGTRPADLAIFSCGNAALGGAAVAKVAGYPLHAFVPDHVNPAIEQRLRELGTDVVKVRRDAAAGGGDPCHNRYLEALRCNGWIPFSCYGHDNWASVEGAETIAAEIAMALHPKPLDAIVVQVGGGGLAHGIVNGFRTLERAGVIPRMPRIFTCQTESCHPLARGYLQLLLQLHAAGAVNLPAALHADLTAGMATPALLRQHADSLRSAAEMIRTKFQASPAIPQVLAAARRGRAHLFPAWADNVPESLADGILDDTTYDGVEVAIGMLESGGLPVIASEEELRTAWSAAHHHTAIRPSPTGSSGLAGLQILMAQGTLAAGEQVCVLFTGIQR